MIQPKVVVLFGIKRSYDDAYEYYKMIRDAYEHYCVASEQKMTPEKENFIMAQKKKVDDTAKLLGLEVEVALPDMTKSKAKKTKKDEERGEEQDEPEIAAAGAVRIPGDVRNGGDRPRDKRKPPRGERPVE